MQLTRRADLIPNLVETVKGYAAHEKGVLEEITNARAQVQEAAAEDDVPAKAAADAELTGALVNLNAVAENYPDLKANPNFLDLQQQLADTENQISFARQYYNDAVATLNTLTRTIPWMFFTGHRRRALARVLPGPRGPGPGAAGQLLEPAGAWCGPARSSQVIRRELLVALLRTRRAARTCVQTTLAVRVPQAPWRNRPAPLVRAVYALSPP